jgi:diaminopimelate decarboxylase
MEKEIQSNYRELNDALHNSTILLSLKANSNPKLLNIPFRDGCKAEVVSINELNSAIYGGCESIDIVYSGPGKSFEECAYAISKGVRSFSVESLSEIDIIGKLAKHSLLSCNLYLRVNPDVSLEIDLQLKEMMSGVYSHFGFIGEEVSEALRLSTKWKLNVLGPHFYFGSQILDAEVYALIFPQLIKQATSLFSSFGGIGYVNLGGGFGVPYNAHDKHLNLNRLKEVIAQISSINPSLSLVFESGRYIFSSSGIYLVSVIDVKYRKGTQIVIVNGSMSQFIRPVFMQTEHRFEYYQKSTQNMPPNYSKMYHSKIVGRSCTPLDVFVSDCILPKCEIGSFIALFNAGAYGWDMSPHCFLGRGPAKEYLLKEDDSIIEISRS